jgi:hypothetical protein
MHRARGGAGQLSLLLGAEGDQVKGAQRAREPSPQVAPVIGVLGDARGHERMSELEQDRRSSAEKGSDGRVAEAADYALGGEVPVAAGETLGMRARSRPLLLADTHTSLYPFACMNRFRYVWANNVKRATLRGWRVASESQTARFPEAPKRTGPWYWAAMAPTRAGRLGVIGIDQTRTLFAFAARAPPFDRARSAFVGA